MTAWRESKAAGMDAERAVLDAAHEALAEAVDVLENRGRDEACTELRAALSRLRLEASTIASEAGELRKTPTPQPFPLALTTRHVRRRPEPPLEPVDPRDADELYVGLGELDAGEADS